MPYTALTVLLGFFAVTLLSLGSHRLMRVRYWAAAGNLIAGFVLLAAGGLLYVLSLNLQTYVPLTPNNPIAELTFNKTGQSSYRATLMRLPAGDLQVFNLNGDAWRLEARVLEWRGWPNVFGLVRQFRLERIGGRARDDNKNSAPPSYSLSSNPGLDLWQWVMNRAEKPTIVQATFTSSDIVPLTDNARYRIVMGPTGVLAEVVATEPPSPRPLTVAK